MAELLTVIFNAMMLIFVITSMFGMGLSLTLKQALAPMKKTTE